MKHPVKAHGYAAGCARRLIGIAALPWLAATAVAASPGLTLAQLHDYAFPANLTSAEKAPVIAWISDDHGVRNVWVASSANANVRQLTTYSEDDGQELTSLTVAADGSRVVYVRGGDHGANWDWSMSANPS